MSKNIFLEASKQKLRFPMRNGLITVEDLWDLDLPALDKLGSPIAKKLRESGDEVSLLSNSNRSDTAARREQQLQLDIIKEVIARKEADATARANAAEKRSQVAFFEDLLEKRKMEQLSGLTAEQIEEQLAILRGEKSQPATDAVSG